MAFRWSSESIVAEHKELQASAMAIDRRGDFALLAGRRNIAIIDLDKPEIVLKKKLRNQKYNASAAEWNPCPHSFNSFVIASGERADMFLWNDEGHFTEVASFKAHTRTITDLNWHPSEPTTLATCSIDTFIHIWDTRETRKIPISLSSIAGASQVKWNKHNPHYLASGHDSDIRIWDRRKTNQPVCYINAHLSKIHGLDWSPNHETQIVSSSNDSTVKIFDITNPRKSELFIKTQSPVWRAKYTPFGEGLVTVVVPPLRRGENSLLLWSIMDMSEPVHTFVGHSDIVLEFEWRLRDDAVQSEFQLVTWGKDNSLRIWKIEQHLLQICGHNVDECLETDEVNNIESSDTDTILGCENVEPRTVIGKESKLEFETNAIGCENSLNSLPKMEPSSLTSNGSDSTLVEAEKRAPPNTLPLCESPREMVLSHSPEVPCSVPALPQTSSALDVSVGSHSGTPSHTLQQEFSSLNPLLEGQDIEVASDVEKRSYQITVKHGNLTAVLGITFPPKYPNGSLPSFRFSSGTTIDTTIKRELLKVLNSTALQYINIKKKRRCLEPCIRMFLNQLKALLTEERSSCLDIGIPGTPLHVSNYFQQYLGQQDYSIPYPRTSGARFSSSGLLVCFTRPTVWRQGPNRDGLTPRSFCALGAAYVSSLQVQVPPVSATSPQYSYMYPSVGQSPSGEKIMSVMMHCYQDRMKKSKRKNEEDGRSHCMLCATIYDVSKLTNVSRDLASAYVLDDEDMLESCYKNKEAASLSGRKDLAQVWSLVAASLSINSQQSLNDDYPWTNHPFGRKMIMSLIDHYHSRFDVQTAALLSCVLGEKMSSLNKNKNLDRWKNRSDANSSGAGGSAYNTIHGINTDGWEMSTVIRHNRSNSEGSLTEAARPALEHNVLLEGSTKNRKKTVDSLLDPQKAEKYNAIRTAYADILYRWDLLEQRAMVNKFVREFPSQNRDFEFHIECSVCGHPYRGAQCRHCKKLPHICSICHLSVRGSSNFCLICSHGGHTLHYYDWFKEFEDCPTGCGCKCLEAMEELFNRPLPT